MITNQPPRIRPRAVILGLILIWPLGRWIFEGEIARYTFGTWAAPFYMAVFPLLVAITLNAIVGKVIGKRLLNSLELLCLFSMLSVAAAMLSTDFMGILMTLIPYPARFANESNQWNELFKGVLPEWLLVRDPAALRSFYEGSSSIWTRQALMVWLKPCAAWSILAVSVFTAFLSLSAILRKRWADEERLTFPCVQLPIAMCETEKHFFSSRLMWIGFGIAAAITLINGIHTLVPSVPYIPIKRQSIALFDVHPFNAVSRVAISFYFFAITLGFLMPSDLSFSLWLFFFLYLVQRIGAQALGYEPNAALHSGEQAFGAYMAIAVFVLWGSRKHLIRAFRRAIGREGPEVDAGEPLTYRFAFTLLGVSLFTMVAFFKVCGMTWGISIVAVAILMLLAVVISRIRCELGFPVHDLHDVGPHTSIPRLIGPENIPKPALGALALTYWTNRVNRSHVMPHLLEATRTGGGKGESGRQMFRAVALAGLAAIPVCFLVYLDGFYSLGASTARVEIWGVGFGAETFGRLESHLKTENTPVAASWIASSIGAVIAGSLLWARGSIIGFPFHPLGFAVANSWGMWYLWLPIFIGWAVKGISLRVGGLKTYRQVTLFLFGLMLGELTVGSLWTIAGLIFNIRTYDFWP